MKKKVKAKVERGQIAVIFKAESPQRISMSAALAAQKRTRASMRVKIFVRQNMLRVEEHAEGGFELPASGRVIGRAGSRVFILAPFVSGIVSARVLSSTPFVFLCEIPGFTPRRLS